MNRDVYHDKRLRIKSTKIGRKLQIAYSNLEYYNLVNAYNKFLESPSRHQGKSFKLKHNCSLL